MIDSGPRPSSGRVQQPGVNAAGYGLRYAVRAIGLLPAQADVDNPRFILDQLADGFAAHGPLCFQVCDAVVLFKRGVVQLTASEM